MFVLFLNWSIRRLILIPDCWQVTKWEDQANSYSRQHQTNTFIFYTTGKNVEYLQSNLETPVCDILIW